ncbi:hypothetical protein [Streptomyces albiaxialis]|uniref:hypothetical protein n=1 Tax=Streptomyces albiaxialis TaxID=329523 RepID=UPI0031DBF629
MPTVVAGAVVATALFGAGGGAVAALIVEISGKPCLAWSWFAVDAFLAWCLSVSYWLVGRYGLRFYDEDPPANPVWRSVTVGNSAWRSLPSRQRKHQRARLRALNSTARLLLADPDDEASRKALTSHADALRRLSTAVLTDNASELLWPTATPPGPVLSPEAYFAVPAPAPAEPDNGMRIDKGPGLVASGTR